MNKIGYNYELMDSVIISLEKLAKNGDLVLTADILQSSFKLSDREIKDIIDYLYNDKDYIRPIYSCYNPKNKHEHIDFKRYTDIPFGKQVKGSNGQLSTFKMSHKYIKTYYFITPLFLRKYKQVLTGSK